MRRLDSELDTGWIIHVYGNNRRLLCTLETSHGWTFLAGLILGLSIAIVAYNLERPTHSTGVSPNPNNTAPLILD